MVLLSFTVIMPSELMDPENYKSFISVYWLFRAVLIHTVPLLVSTINQYLLTDSVIYLTDIWIVPLVAYTYLLVQYCYVALTGEVVYTGQDWDWSHPITWASITIGPLLGAGFHLMNSLGTQVIRQRYEWQQRWWTERF